MTKRNLLIAIYSPPEYYPPTLNAIESLSGIFEKVHIVYRNYSGDFDWEFPSQVQLIPVGKNIHVRDAERVNPIKKLFYFLQYSFRLFIIIWQTRPDTLLLYDYMPVLSLRLIWQFIKKPGTIWYHNHDVGDANLLRKWSISWFAWKSEKWIFPRLSIFSLPALDRKLFFQMNKFEGKFYFIPNFPSLKIFERYDRESKSLSSEIKIIYQGSIGPLHGLEEIIGILNNEIGGKGLKMFLKGFISEDYQNELINLARKNAVEDRLIFLPHESYGKVIKNSKNYHIGIGIYMKNDIMNKTLGTSSNKIYEYAAAGLPVLIYDNAHFRSYLGNFEWVFFTDCSGSSLMQSINKIILNYEQLSFKAKMNFENELNFERYIEPVLHYLGS